MCDRLDTPGVLSLRDCGKALARLALDKDAFRLPHDATLAEQRPLRNKSEGGKIGPLGDFSRSFPRLLEQHLGGCNILSCYAVRS